MTQDKIKELIRENFTKSMSIINDKKITESLLMTALNEVVTILNGKIKFTTENIVDTDGDEIKRITVENTKNGYSETIINYFFHREKVFPVAFNYFNVIRMDCNNIDDVNSFIERLVSDESFMIKIIRVAENTDKIDDEIPF